MLVHELLDTTDFLFTVALKLIIFSARSLHRLKLPECQTAGQVGIDVSNSNSSYAITFPDFCVGAIRRLTA